MGTPRIPTLSVGFVTLRKSICKPAGTLAACRSYSAVTSAVTPEPRTSNPLRILFCGTDAFSVASLRALRAEQLRDPDHIRSIDVLVRPAKRTGRGLKVYKPAELKGVAGELGIRIHERDTFTGWDLPRPENESINLIIAVSFGLFVPPRILYDAEYGGLNVHPSMLPDLAGPAPLQHAIIRGDKHIGVTLQTLDPVYFDQGVVLAQTPRPGFEIPDPECITFSQLQDFVAPKAADLLIQGIRDRLYVPPVSAIESASGQAAKHAGKITSSDREIDLTGGVSVQIVQQYRALGRLWMELCTDNGTIRATLEGLDVTTMPLHPQHPDSPAERDVFKFLPDPWREHFIRDGEFVAHSVRSTTGTGIQGLTYVHDGDAIVIRSREGRGIRVRNITLSGQPKRPARIVMANLWAASVRSISLFAHVDHASYVFVPGIAQSETTPAQKQSDEESDSSFDDF